MIIKNLSTRLHWALWENLHKINTTHSILPIINMASFLTQPWLFDSPWMCYVNPPCNFCSCSCRLTASCASLCIVSNFSSVTDFIGIIFGLHSIGIGVCSVKSSPCLGSTSLKTSLSSAIFKNWLKSPWPTAGFPQSPNGEGGWVQVWAKNSPRDGVTFWWYGNVAGEICCQFLYFSFVYF